MRTCAKCGRPFSGGTNERFCPVCTVTLLKGNEKKQENIKNFVRDNQGVSEREVMEKFGVSKKFVRQMFTNKNLVNTSGSEIRYPCANCGKVITEGVYCNECFLILRKEVKRQSEHNAYLQELLNKDGKAPKYDGTILIVDYNELNLNVFKFILESGLQNYKISVAVNVGGAVNIIHNQKVSLILLDDTVSNAYDGMKILKQIRLEPAAKEIPVVMMSKKADKQTISKGLSRGATDYIGKPFEPADLIDRVKKNLGLEVEKNSKILLVEDLESDIEQEIEILEETFPCIVTTAKNGIEALHLLGDSAFDTDIVLVSLEMSFMDGFEFLSFVTEDEYMRRFPVLMMTTSTDVNILSRIKKSFAKGYIRKPNISAEGLELIAKILDAE